MTEDLNKIKRVLRSVRWTQQRLEADMEHLALLRAKAESIGAMQYDKIMVSSGVERRPLEDAVAALVDYEAHLARDVTRWHEALQRVHELIDAVPNAQYRVILYKHYRDFEPWEKIAADLGYTWRHVHRLHAAALKAANDQLEKMSLFVRVDR